MAKQSSSPAVSRRQALVASTGMAIAMIAPSWAADSGTFKALWANHPFSDVPGLGQGRPCGNILNISRLVAGKNDLVWDQCAIRMGVCLKRTFPRLHFRDFAIPARGQLATCGLITKHGFKHDDNMLHILNATDFALSLRHAGSQQLSTFSWLGSAEVYERSPSQTNPFRQKIKGRNGVVFIQNFWIKRGGDGTGSHIDLWDGDRRVTKKEIHYSTPQRTIDDRYDRIAERVIFWPVI
jgi:hypothetical protein